MQIRGVLQAAQALSGHDQFIRSIIGLLEDVGWYSQIPADATQEMH